MHDTSGDMSEDGIDFLIISPCSTGTDSGVILRTVNSKNVYICYLLDAISCLNSEYNFPGLKIEITCLAIWYVFLNQVTNLIHMLVRILSCLPFLMSSVILASLQCYFYLFSSAVAWCGKLNAIACASETCARIPRSVWLFHFCLYPSV